MSRRFLPASNLPSFIMPCPCCGGRMTPQPPAASQRIAGGVEDVIHACRQCGAELTRTVRVASAQPLRRAAYG